jgi:hypothetical protein
MSSDKEMQTKDIKAKDFGNTHHVKKLLETYIDTAGRTLTGPANSSIEDAPYKSARNVTYKLPPEIELSKTSCLPEEEERTAKSMRDDIPAKFKLESSEKMNNGMVTLSR